MSKRFWAVLIFFAMVFNHSLPDASAQRRRASEIVDLVVLGGAIVTMNATRQLIEDGGIAVKGGRIVAVGSRADIARRYTGRQTVDATGKTIIPGLINGHTHIPMVLFRGLADDLDLQDWLTKYIFPAEAKNVTEEFVRAGTRLGLAEMVRGGTTTYCDMYYFEDAIADETAKAGVRGVLGETVIDFPVADNKTNAEAMAYVERFVKKWQGHELIVPAIAPHAPYTVSEEHLKAARAFSDRTGSPIVTHISETKREVDDSIKAKGTSPIEYLARIGFLNERVIAAHVVWPTANELDILKRSGVGIVHNPQSNMKLAAGVAPVPQMLRDGLLVGLGTDGAASNNDLSMWEEMDTAAKLHKVFSGDPKVISAQEALELATIRGAQALHLEKEIGSIETGKRADLVLVERSALNQIPSYNLYSDLVYATKASGVQTVIINGRIVMQNRRLLTLDEAAIRVTARIFRERILKSLSNPGEGSRQLDHLCLSSRDPVASNKNQLEMRGDLPLVGVKDHNRSSNRR
ncbi:MAG: amidohydrolase [Acidobacteriota bacterium]|nr:amidohydrolase [Acidobacteriota bacterium]